MQTAADTFFDHRLWRPILDREREAFSDLVPGAAIALVQRDVAQAEQGPMLLWRKGAGGMTGTSGRFDGFAVCEADIILVVDDEAERRLGLAEPDDAGAELRRLVRRGHIVLYFLKCEGALVDGGYETFLDALGLTIMGACR